MFSDDNLLPYSLRLHYNTQHSMSDTCGSFRRKSDWGATLLAVQPERLVLLLVACAAVKHSTPDRLRMVKHEVKFECAKYAVVIQLVMSSTSGVIGLTTVLLPVLLPPTVHGTDMLHASMQLALGVEIPLCCGNFLR